nr:hypothetical protein Iba_chr10bCG11520 [Ipomoea batatas]GME10777.1 hypothetical protein Iba_scaffold10765CG0020 [Ipomoea batatas]GME10780.1 hypothetical protein Iba_scaffold10766CG0020 [Ipomoea batatas]
MPEDSHDHHSKDSHLASLLALGPQLEAASLSSMIQKYGTNQCLGKIENTNERTKTQLTLNCRPAAGRGRLEFLPSPPAMRVDTEEQTLESSYGKMTRRGSGRVCRLLNFNGDYLLDSRKRLEPSEF